MVQACQESHDLLEKVPGEQSELQVQDELLQASQENHVLLEKIKDEQVDVASVRWCRPARKKNILVKVLGEYRELQVNYAYVQGKVLGEQREHHTEEGQTFINQPEMFIKSG